MPSPVIDTTVGGTAANSYVTVGEADQYALERIPVATAWNAAATDTKSAALMMACRRLQQEEFYGQPIKPFGPDLTGAGSTGQALSWPRWGVTDINKFPIVVQTQIPSFVKRAQMELAFALLADNIVDNTGMEPYEGIRVGPLDIKPSKSYVSYPLPASCRREIAHVLMAGGGGTRLVRG